MTQRVTRPRGKGYTGYESHREFSIDTWTRVDAPEEIPLAKRAPEPEPASQTSPIDEKTEGPQERYWCELRLRLQASGYYDRLRRDSEVLRQREERYYRDWGLTRRPWVSENTGRDSEVERGLS